MMFGGHDEQQQANGMMPPAPDGGLAQNDGAGGGGTSGDNTSSTNYSSSDMPQPTPLQHQDNSDSAGDYLMDDVNGSSSPAPAAVAPSGSDDLLQIKQQALQQLSPLLGHLEQTPVEKFRTTMMLIQASDNKNLIPVAYAAAKEIADEKVRAQALLDVVNEINYFTQQEQDDTEL